MNPRYERAENEDKYEYGLRLIETKVEQNPSDLEWQDIVELLDMNVHYDSLRKAVNVTPYSGYHVMQYFKRKYEGSNKHSEYFSELEKKTLEFQKERQRFFDQRVEYNKVVRKMARNDETIDIIERVLESGKLPQLEYRPSVSREGAFDMLISLNDIHFGAVVDNYWNYYNSDVCREMMNYYLDRIFETARHYDIEGCWVWANGDLINGNIHKTIAVSNKENVIEQVIGVSELIANFLAELSNRFKWVYFSSVAGNHSRIEDKNSASIHERLDDLIEWYLKARLQNFENVRFDRHQKIDDTMYLLNVRGKIYLGVHGDYEINETKVQALRTMAKEPIYAILSGHYHHNKIDTIQKVKTIMAGSFLGMDDFCVGKRICGDAEQLICVCDHSGIVASVPVEFNTEEFKERIGRGDAIA